MGDLQSRDTKALFRCVHSHYLPNKVLIHCHHKTSADGAAADAPEDQEAFSWLREKLEILRNLSMADGKATAYVCENYTCALPVNSVNQLEKLLKKF